MAQYLDTLRLNSAESRLRDDLVAASKANNPETAPDQRILADRFQKAIFDRPHPVAAAWQAYRQLGNVVNEVRKELKIPDDAPAVQVEAGPQLETLVANLEVVLKLINEPGSIRTKIVVALAGLLQIRGLLAEVTRPAHLILKSKDPRAQRAIRAFKEFENLRWYPTIKTDLGDVRNGWSHGWARLEGDNLVVLDKTTGKRASTLGIEDVVTYLVAGRYAWEAFMINPLWLRSMAAPFD